MSKVTAKTLAKQVIEALNARNAAQYSKDNDISLKLVSEASMQVLIDSDVDCKAFVQTVQAHDKKTATSFIAVKALVKVLQALNAVAQSSVAKLDDYTAIILHNATLLQNAINYDVAAYSLCKQIEFDADKLENISSAASAKLSRKNVKASTMTTQRSSSKNALQMLNVVTFSDDKVITLNLESVITEKLLALVK